VRDDRVTGAKIDLDAPKLGAAATLDPREPLLPQVASDPQFVVLVRDPAVFENPDAVHDEPVAFELLRELSFCDEVPVLVSHRGESVQIALRVTERDRGSRQRDKNGRRNRCSEPIANLH
jgi:hypothetical protein